MLRRISSAFLFGLGSLCLNLLLIQPATANVILRGAGATFPAPLYQKWIETYQRQTKVRVSYEPLGSGAGIKQLVERAIDFGATDTPLSGEELQKAPGEILHLPTCLGAVVLTYHLPAIRDLKLTPKLISDIFLGQVSQWSDRRIAEVNPDADLPQLPITIVHRAEASGTTGIFTDYLSQVSPEWQARVGQGRVVKWPTGAGVEGNQGIAALVKKIPGSIGYLELAHARMEQLPTAWLKNRSGRFVEPTIKSVTAAADIAMPPAANASIIDSPVADGYPIAAFTYIIFYQEQSYSQRSLEQARELADFLWWMVHDGQQYCEPSHYAPLPATLIARAEQMVRAMAFEGRALPGL
jgi:phosphate transport system substrate-binding protein